MTMTRIGLLLTRVAQTLTVALCAATVTASAAGSGADWPAFGGDPGGSQHSPLAQINKANVKQLKLAWQHRSGDFIDAPSPKGSLLQVTPLHANGTLYFCTPLNRVFALDPASGKERWVFDPHRPDPRTGRAALSPPLVMASRCRGVAYWQEDNAGNDKGACRKRIFKNGESSRVYALDADTGLLCADFGAAKGHPGWASHADYENHGEGLMASSTSPPTSRQPLASMGHALQRWNTRLRGCCARSVLAKWTRLKCRN